MRTLLLTALALLGFAANSVLCRLALSADTIDAASFTGVRLLAGAAMLLVLNGARRGDAASIPGGASFISAFALFAYAAAFSLAYLRLPAGVGALVLFGFVQLTMIGFGLSRGERMSPRQWIGFALAVSGLVALTAPGLSAPDPLGASLMALSGVAWGAYSLRGARVGDPLRTTAGNFARALPFAAVFWVAMSRDAEASPQGLWLAAASGAIASGLAYSLWYAALRGLRATQAAIVQLLTPVLAAAGGVVWLEEAISLRVLAAGAAILLGVALAVWRRRERS